MPYEIFFGSSSSDDEVNSELALFMEACWEAFQASKPKIPRIHIDKDHYGTHNGLVAAYFSEHPVYDEATFRTRFRMSRKRFTQIAREVTDHSCYFQQTTNYAGTLGLSQLMKCTLEIRQMAYGVNLDALVEYLQMVATTARKCLRKFCKAIMELYGEEFLRKPTYTDIERLYAHHEQKHGFLGMIGSIDCTGWPWANCPQAHRTQFARGDHGIHFIGSDRLPRFIELECVLWCLQDE